MDRWNNTNIRKLYIMAMIMFYQNLPFISYVIQILNQFSELVKKFKSNKII